MQEPELRLGMKVEVAETYACYPEWKGTLCVITGLSKRARDRKANVTIEEVFGSGETDGFEAGDLVIASF